MSKTSQTRQSYQTFDTSTINSSGLQFKAHEKRAIIEQFMNNDEVFLVIYNQMFAPRVKN